MDHLYDIIGHTGPYPPGLNVSISYDPPEKPQVKATISEIPRWPGYETVEFKMNITKAEDNTLLGRYNASAENSTIEIPAPLPESVINKCVTLKISASAMSERYGEGRATENFIELYKSKLRIKFAGSTPRVSFFCEFPFFFTESAWGKLIYTNKKLCVVS